MLIKKITKSLFYNLLIKMPKDEINTLLKSKYGLTLVQKKNDKSKNN
jgi:hypothetical protein